MHRIMTHDQVPLECKAKPPIVYIKGFGSA
jgi:hypothetical protein